MSPSQIRQQWYDNVVALTKEVREEVGRVVLEAYSQLEEGRQPATEA